MIFIQAMICYPVLMMVGWKLPDSDWLAISSFSHMITNFVLDLVKVPSLWPRPTHICLDVPLSKLLQLDRNLSLLFYCFGPLSEISF